MAMHHGMRKRVQSLKQMGRLGFALVAGGVFAFLAWSEGAVPDETGFDVRHRVDLEPSAPAEEAVLDEDRSNAVRVSEQSIVRDGDALQHFERQHMQARSEDRWALTRMKASRRPWLASEEGAGGTATQLWEERVAAHQQKGNYTVVTEEPNSRAPPRG